MQQAFLRLLEGTTVTLQAKPPPITAGSKKEGKDDIGGEGWASDANLRNGLSGMGPKRGVRDGLPGFGASGSSELISEAFGCPLTTRWKGRDFCRGHV